MEDHFLEQRIFRLRKLEGIIPFRSEKQRRYLWAKHPEIAKKWTKEYGSKPQPQKKSFKKRGK